MLSTSSAVKEEHMGRSRVGGAEPSADGLLEDFVGYLVGERGVSARTVEAYEADVRRFLACLGAGGVRGLTAADVSNAVLGQVAEGRAPATVRRFGCAVRSFLRYCHVVGLVDGDLSSAVLPVSGRRRSLLPQGITARDAAALLGACDRRRVRGRRDYAVILLILRLGLRASEVATLRLDDLDWRSGQLTIHGKGGRVDELPMPVDVGVAIAAYLRGGRREAMTREVFLRVTPPLVGLTRGGVTGIVAAAARRAGIGVVRAHRLRHTAATDMLRHGAALTEIGQVLRHRSLGSTAIYAGVDVERLRSIARPWPEGWQW
jgi:integrase/recombinase XerD